MIAQCPECESQFKVEQKDLEAANGLVRCGACLKVFDAKVNEYKSRTANVDHELDAIEAQINEISTARHQQPRNRHKTQSTTPLRSKALSALEATKDNFAHFDIVQGKPEHFEATEPFFGQEISTGASVFKETTDTDQLNAEIEKLNASKELEPSKTTELPQNNKEQLTAKVLPKKPDQPRKLSKLDEDIMDFFSTSDTVTHKGSGVTGYEFAQKQSNRETVQESKTSAYLKNRHELELSDEPIVFDENNEKSSKTFLAYGIIGLVLVLITSLFWLSHQAYTLGENPQYRPYLAVYCKFVGCKLPPKYHIKYLKITSSNIKEIEKNDTNQLQVDVILFNVNTIDMPFPRMIVELTSLNGDSRFSYPVEPEEYLKGDLKGSMLPSKSSAHLNFNVPQPDVKNLSHKIYPRYSNKES